MKIDKKDLLPCPFCGGGADVDEWEDSSLWSNKIVFWFSIGCSDCDYHMTFCADMEKAIETWNKRYNIKVEQND
jgi:Lar family restriction alleviation protein